MSRAHDDIIFTAEGGERVCNCQKFNSQNILCVLKKKRTLSTQSKTSQCTVILVVNKIHVYMSAQSLPSYMVHDWGDASTVEVVSKKVG